APPAKPVQATPGVARRLEEAKAEAARCQERLKAAEAALAAEVARRDAQVAALQRAAAPPRITSPDLFNVLALALAGGLIFGGVLVLAADGLDRTITTPELAARCFGVPVLGVVTKTLTPKERARRRVRRFVLAPLAALVLLAVLCAAFFNTLAWLKYPDEFDDWKARPLGFASQKVQQWAEGLQGTL
ncbi:MAG: hypothetical protein NT049_18555, partial [Planctomycetota bacterium]|nr:hypothetical protein [Planctomycetota bacterium]